MFRLTKRARDLMLALPLALLTLTGCTTAQDDCAADRYHPPETISLSRPVSVVLVDAMPQIDGCVGNWACAANAFGQGRAIIYLKKGHEACLYHELAHVSGWRH